MTPDPRAFATPHVQGLHGERDLITVICLSFNTRGYIARCFDAILAQKVDYRLQIVVHDDASSDGSQEVIRGYADRYPDIFTPILQPANRWSQGFCPLRACAEYVRGAYVAICEVDDYWTDPTKLHQQVAYLNESGRNFIGTQCRSITDGDAPGPAFPKSAQNGLITIIKGSDIYSMRKYIHTSTFFMLRTLFEKWAAAFTKQVVSADLTVLLTACLVDDGLAILNQVTSHYRIHAGGTWTGSSRAARYERYAVTWQIIIDSLGAEFPPPYRRLAQNNLAFFRTASRSSKQDLLSTLAAQGPVPVAQVSWNMLMRRLLGN